MISGLWDKSVHGSSVSFTTYASNIDPDGDDGASLFIAPTFGNQPTIFITSSGIVNVDEKSTFQIQLFTTC